MAAAAEGSGAPGNTSPDASRTIRISWSLNRSPRLDRRSASWAVASDLPGRLRERGDIARERADRLVELGGREPGKERS